MPPENDPAGYANPFDQFDGQPPAAAGLPAAEAVEPVPPATRVAQAAPTQMAQAQMAQNAIPLPGSDPVAPAVQQPGAAGPAQTPAPPPLRRVEPEGLPYYQASPSPIVNEVTPSFLATAVDKTKAITKDIAKGTMVEAPRASLRGMLMAADNTAGALNDLGDWLNQNVADLKFEVPATGIPALDAAGGAVLNPVDAIKRSLHAMVDYVSPPQSNTGQFIEATAQFLVGFLPALRVARASGLGPLAAPAAAGGVSDFLTRDPNEEGVVNTLIKAVPALQQPVLQYLATNPDDPQALNRLRHSIEGLGFGALTDVIVRGLRVVASARRSARNVESLEQIDLDVGKTYAQGLDVMGDPSQPMVIVKSPRPQTPMPASPMESTTPTANAALTQSAAETVTGVPDHVAAKGVVRDAESGLLALVDTAEDGTVKAAKSGTGRKGVYINLGRIETADDVKAMIQQVADAMAPQVNAAKRGVQTHDETSRLATRLGLTAEELIARPKGQALNAEQIVAANRILTTSAESLWWMAEKAAAPTASIIDGFNFRRALAVHNAIQKAVLGANAEAGRALNALKIARSSSGAAMNRELTAITERLGGSAISTELAQNMLRLRAEGVGEGAIDAAVRRGWLATSQGMARESYALGQLWNPRTHIRNFASNLIVGFQQAYERGAAGQIGRLLGTSVDEAIPPAEAISYLYGQVSALKDAFRLSGRALMTGESTGAFTKIDIRENAISSAAVARERGLNAADAAAFSESTVGRVVDFVGAVTRAPGHALTAGDQFFKTIALSGEIRAQALRKATQEGLTGKQLIDRVSDLVANPPEWLQQAGIDHALYATFNNQPGPVAQALLKIRNYDGVVNPTFMIAPYLRTPSNILRYTANRTPAAMASRMFWDDIAAGGARRDLALARMATGTAVMAGLLDYASSGAITGGGPRNRAERAALLGTGWKPYSVKIGDTYYSYQGMEPLSTIIAFAASYAEMIKASDLSPEDYDTAEELLGQAVSLVSANVIEKSYFSGIAGFFAALEDSQQNPGSMSVWGMRQVSGVVPLASVGRTINDIIDPTRRQAADFKESIMSQIPGLRQNLIPSRSVWGEPISPQAVYGRLYDNVSPFGVSRETGSPIDNELVRLRSGVLPIGWKESFAGPQGGSVRVNFRDYPQVLDEYRRLAGNELKLEHYGRLGAKEFLDSLVSGASPFSTVYHDLYSDGPDGGKIAFIKSRVSEYRKAAQRQILESAPTKYPAFYAYLRQKEMEQRENKLPPAMQGQGLGAIGLPQ